MGDHEGDTLTSTGKKVKWMSYIEHIAVTKALRQQLKDKFIFTKMITEEELVMIDTEV